MTFFYDMNKKLAELAQDKQQLTEGAQPAVAEGSKLNEYGDTPKGQKKLSKVYKRAVDRYADDTIDPAIRTKASSAADAAYLRMHDPATAVTRKQRQQQMTSTPSSDDEFEDNSPCPECDGTGEDTLDSGEACWRCHGTGVDYYNKDDVAEGSTGDYSAKKARAGKDIGKPGKQFAKIARGAAKRYGSKERGEKVAGAVLAKLRKGVGEAAKPDFLDLDKDGNRTEPMKQAARQAKKGPVDEVKLSDLPVRQVKGRAYGAQPEEFDQDDEEVQDKQPKKRGRPKGTGRSMGAKGPSGQSKLLKKGAIAEELPPGAVPGDEGEYGLEGDMAKDQIHTIVRNAQDLEKVLSDREDLPEWVQAKLAKIEGMMTAVSEYMQTQHERDDETEPPVELDEKAVSVAQRRAAGIARAAQKGEIPKSKLRGASKEMSKMPAKELKKFAKTKEKGLPEKKSKEEVEETTVSGSVATAPAAAAKSAKGMQFGKGIYDSLNRELEAMISESMSINISSSTEGSPSVSVTATDDDAARLAGILRNAGIGTDVHSHDSHNCADVVDENKPDWPTDTEQCDDALQYSGGLNKPKTTVAGDGQTTVPVTAVQVQEDHVDSLDQIVDRYPQAVAHFKQYGSLDRELRDALYDYYFQRGSIMGDDDPHEFLAQKLEDFLGMDESQHMAEAKCMECGMYEDSCECDHTVDEGMRRMLELAGVTEAAKPDFLDLDRDRKESMKQAAADKEENKVDESILDMSRLWQQYKAQ